MNILPAGPEHVADIARLADIVWRAHYPGIISAKQINYMLARMYDLDVLRGEMREGITYLRALEGDPPSAVTLRRTGRLLGFAAYGPDGNRIKLYKLYVDPSHQRRGIGRTLIDQVERASVGRTLVLTVNKRNHQAIAAYQKHGFVIRESIVVDIGGGFVMDDYVMEKKIAGSTGKG